MIGVVSVTICPKQRGALVHLDLAAVSLQLGLARAELLAAPGVFLHLGQQPDPIAFVDKYSFSLEDIFLEPNGSVGKIM